jgi:D-Tyr-tRNAtyr deacylase
MQNIPLSTAAQLRDAEIARLEAGSRARSGANWYDFDQNQARAVSDAVRQATSSADDLGARRALRQTNIDTRKNQAFNSVNEGAFNADMTALRANLESAMRSPDASNPAVRNMLNEIRNEMDRLGPDFTVQHLATIRYNLSGKSPLMPQNAYQAAPRDSVATMNVLQNVDDILNNATNKRWQDVVTGYARDSDPVRAAQAAGKVREAYWDNTGRVRKTAADVSGDVPLITQFNLGSAIDNTRGPTKNVLLSNEANMRLNSVLDALRQQDIVKGVKRSATAGGGSNTASDMFAAKSAGAVADAVTSAAGGPAAAVGKGVIDSLRDYANRNKDRALAEALQNPQQMISLLEAKIASKAPMTAKEQYLYSLLRGAPAAATN